jgi:hypothetical protein
VQKGLWDGLYDPMTGMPYPGNAPDYGEMSQRMTNFEQRLPGHIASGIRDWIAVPGQAYGTVPGGPPTPEQEMEWGRGTALGMLGASRLPGAAPEGAVGAAGSKLIQPDDLRHGISQIKLSKPVSEMSATYAPIRDVAETQITPANLQGGVLLPAMGDRSIANTNLTGFNGYRFDTPVEMQGGHGFMEANADKGVAWASGAPVIGRIANNVRKLSEEGTPVYFPYTAMGERSVDFSHHISDSLAEALKQQPLSRTAQREFNAAMKAEDSDFGAIKDWPGVGSENLRDYLLASKGDVRKIF